MLARRVPNLSEHICVKSDTCDTRDRGTFITLVKLSHQAWHRLLLFLSLKVLQKTIRKLWKSFELPNLCNFLAKKSFFVSLLLTRQVFLRVQNLKA